MVGKAIGKPPLPGIDGKLIENWLARVYRRTHSQPSVNRYFAGLVSFSKFYGNTLGTALINGKGVTWHKVIDDYITWADKQQLSAMTVRTNISAVINFLQYLEVPLDPVKLKQIVKPKAIRIPDEPLTPDKIVKILSHKNKTIVALVVLLISSGMRVGEAIQLKVKDLHVDEMPARISIKAEYTKTAEARDTFISIQALTFLKPLINNKQPDDKIFSKDYSSLNKQYKTVLRQTGLLRKLESHKFSTLHLHVYRKYFFSTAVGIIGETAAHALMGHSFYLKTYYMLPLKQRQETYLKLEPSIMFNLPVTPATYRGGLEGFSHEKLGNFTLCLAV